MAFGEYKIRHGAAGLILTLVGVAILVCGEADVYRVLPGVTFITIGLVEALLVGHFMLVGWLVTPFMWVKGYLKNRFRDRR